MQSKIQHDREKDAELNSADIPHKYRYRGKYCRNTNQGCRAKYSRTEKKMQS
jgi:hypothetical protein